MSDITPTSKIRVIGIGNAGVALLKNVNADFADIIAVDTDLKTLTSSKLKNVFACGGKITDDMGCGGDAAMAKEAAIANVGQLKSFVEGAETVIIMAGLGGGTGSVIAPIMSKLACETSVKSIISLVIMPLAIEGAPRAELAQKAFNYLRKHSNIAAALPNDTILARSNSPLKEAFEKANDCVSSACAALLDILAQKGIVNIDFATFKKIFDSLDAKTFLAFGSGMGETAIEDAISDLKNCPLLNGRMPRALNMLVSVVGGNSLEMNKTQLLLEALKMNFAVRSRVGFAVNTRADFDTKIEVRVIGTEAEDVSEVFSNVTESAPTTMPTPAPIVVETPLKAPHKRQTTRPVIETAKISAENPQVEQSSAVAQDSTVDTSKETTVEQETPTSTAPVPAEDETKVHVKKRKGLWPFGRDKGNEKPQDKQGEFEFMDKSQQRGFFADTPPNLRNNEDLDVPTFMRRNIKINL